MRSLITGLASEEMPRVRLGILGHDRRRSELADYVLEEFEPGEVVVAREAVETAADAAETVVVEGLAEAMNRFNVRRAREGGSAADE
jgi:PTH1 family peptidyl-tRNA hydrolase